MYYKLFSLKPMDIYDLLSLFFFKLNSKIKIEFVKIIQ